MSENCEEESKDWTEVLADKPGSVMFVGKTMKGKSYAMKYIILYLWHELNLFSGGWCFSGTQEISDQYDWLPKHARIAGYSDDKFEAILNHLKAHKEKTGQDPPRTFLILDDLLGVLKKSQKLESLITTLRHYNCQMFICSQHLRSTSVPPWLRDNVWHKVFFATGNINAIKTIYNEFASDYEGTIKQFQRDFKIATREPFHALLITENKEHNFSRWCAPAEYETIPLDFK